MVVAGVAVVVAGIERLESRASRAEVARVGASAGEQSKTRLYAVGDRAAAIPGVEFRRADKTVLLYISSTCIYCAHSMDFYRTLVDSDPRRNGRYQVVAVSAEPAATFDVFLRRFQLVPDRAVVLSRPDPKVTRHRLWSWRIDQV